MKKLLLIFFLLSSILVYAQTTPTQPFVTMGLPPSPGALTPISTAPEKDISQLNEEELLAKIKTGTVSDADYLKIKSLQLTEKVRTEIKDLAKLNAAELGKSFGFDSLSIKDAKDIKYQDKKLLHPKGGSLAVEEAKGKQLLITGDKFILLEGKKGISIDGKLKDVKINKDGSVDAGKFGKIKGKEEVVLMNGDSPDELLTNAESLEIKGKTVTNAEGAKFKTIVRENGDFGVEVLEGKPVRVVHQLDKERKIETTVSPSNKYYAIDDNTKHGLQNGGTLVYTKGDKSHILTSDAHSIFVFDNKENLAKVITGYEATKSVAATYEEKKDNLLLRRFDVKEGNGFTLYKESGLVSPKDPGIKMEEIVAETGITYDIDKKSLKGKLTISTNGVDVFITPKGVKTESIAIKRMKELYAAVPETTISVGKHEITMSPNGDVDVGRDIFKTMAETIAPGTGKATPARKIERVEDIEEGMSDWVVQDKPTGKEIARFNTKATVYWTCLEDDLGGYSSFEACVKIEGAGVREEDGKLMLYKVEKGKIVSEELTETNKRGYRGPGAGGTLDIGDIAVPKEIFDKYKGRIGWIQLTDGQWAKVRIADIGGDIKVREENGKKYYDLDLYVGNGASNANELGGLGKGSLVTRGTKGKYNQLIITDEVDPQIIRKAEGVSPVSISPQQKIPIGAGEYTSIADAFRDYGYEGQENFAARKQVYESLFPEDRGKYRGTAQQNIKFLNTLRDNTKREQIEQLLPEDIALSPVQQQRIVDNAQQFLDVPYEWGGIDESGIDCSGLVCRAYRGSGARLPRTTANGYYNNYALRNTGGDALTDIATFTPGMACFWWNRDRTRISHTGVYAGHGEVIHASGNAGRVLRDALTNIIPERFAGCHELST